jgi:RecA-family ATPase
VSAIDLDILKSEIGEPETASLRNDYEARPKLTLRQPDEVLAMQFDNSDIILGDRLFAKGQSLVIAGQGGLGKSRLLLQLAACVTSGRTFLAFNTAGSHLRRLILQVQNSNRRLKDDFTRIKAWLGDADWKRFNEQVIIHTLENDQDGFVSLDSLENQSAIQAVIQDAKPDIICADPLDEFGAGDLNKDVDMQETLTALSRLCRMGNPERGIIVIHHALTGRGGAIKATGYDRASFARNSKTLLAWTRGQINLASVDEENYDRLIVACGKCSNGREFQPFAVRLNPDTMLYECDS